MQKDPWSRPPAGFTRVADMQTWLEQQRLDKDQLIAALSTLCDGVRRELEIDLTIHRDHVFPPAVILPVRLCGKGVAACSLFLLVRQVMLSHGVCDCIAQHCSAGQRPFRCSNRAA